MKTICFALAALAATTLGACTDSFRGSSRSDAGTLGGSTSNRSSDTLGTQRRMDVYGAATSPVLPTMGAPGFGK